MKETFRKLSERITEIVGSAYALIVATILVIVWGVSGPFFNYNDTWLLLINTVTTIITFLMVFVIQASQNRESKATQIKLNELIRAVEKAHNTYIGVENATDATLVEVENEILEEVKNDSR